MLYLYKDDVLISGLKTRHWSYVGVTIGDSSASGEDALQGKLYMLEQQVIQCFHSKNIIIQKKEIATCVF